MQRNSWKQAVLWGTSGKNQASYTISTNVDGNHDSVNSGTCDLLLAYSTACKYVSVVVYLSTVNSNMPSCSCFNSKMLKRWLFGVWGGRIARRNDPNPIRHVWVELKRGLRARLHLKISRTLAAKFQKSCGRPSQKSGVKSSVSMLVVFD